MLTPRRSSCRRHHPVPVALVALAVAGLMGACGGDDATSGQTPDTAAGTTDTAVGAAPDDAPSVTEAAATTVAVAAPEGSTGTGTAVLTMAGNVLEFEHTDTAVPCAAVPGTAGYLLFSGTNAAGDELYVGYSAAYPDETEITYVIGDGLEEWAGGTTVEGSGPVTVTVTSEGRAAVDATLVMQFTAASSAEPATIDVVCS